MNRRTAELGGGGRAQARGAHEVKDDRAPTYDEDEKEVGNTVSESEDSKADTDEPDNLASSPSPPDAATRQVQRVTPGGDDEEIDEENDGDFSLHAFLSPFRPGTKQPRRRDPYSDDDDGAPTCQSGFEIGKLGKSA